MLTLNMMVLFCEDIREEKGDIVTLIGLFPDTVTVDQARPSGITDQTPKIISKLCIYGRINFDPDMDLGTPELWLVMADSSRVPLGKIAPEIVQKARSDAKQNGNLLAGVISRVVIGGFQPQNGQIRVEVDIGGEITVAGALTFIVPH